MWNNNDLTWRTPHSKIWIVYVTGDLNATRDWIEQLQPPYNIRVTPHEQDPETARAIQVQGWQFHAMSDDQIRTAITRGWAKKLAARMRTP